MQDEKKRMRKEDNKLFIYESERQ